MDMDVNIEYGYDGYVVYIVYIYILYVFDGTKHPCYCHFGWSIMVVTVEYLDRPVQKQTWNFHTHKHHILENDQSCGLFVTLNPTERPPVALAGTVDWFDW